MARPAASILPLSYSPLSDLRARAHAPTRVSVTFVTFHRPSPPHRCAILIPRAFVLVERKTSGRLGSNPAAPLVAGKRSNLEKMPWKEVAGLQGNIENQFLRKVLLGESILPYRIFQEFEGVIPVDEVGHLLSSTSAEEAGYPHLSAWMKGAEISWDSNGKGKRTFTEQLDYIGQLLSQFPISQLRVVYSKSGSQPAAMVLRDSRAVVDHMLYWATPSSEQEAAYLAAILNSETARSQAAQFQARGQFGARHFDKVMFNLPIPKFKVAQSVHRALAEVGTEAERVASLIEIPEGERFVAARQRVRRALMADGIGNEIEKLVEKLLRPA